MALIFYIHIEVNSVRKTSFDKWFSVQILYTITQGPFYWYFQNSLRHSNFLCAPLVPPRTSLQLYIYNFDIYFTYTDVSLYFDNYSFPVYKPYIMILMLQGVKDGCQCVRGQAVQAHRPRQGQFPPRPPWRVYHYPINTEYLIFSCLSLTDEFHT